MDSERALRYPNILRAVAETPWAILPSALSTILEIVSLRAQGRRFSETEIQERIALNAAARTSRGAYVAGTVAVIPIYGVIVPRATLFTQISGGCSLDEFTQNLRDAVGDEQISAVLLDVNSPGGSVEMLTEAAAVMRDLRGTKPIAAIANATCASGALWLASQCDEISATPSAMYGSQGVIAVHEDISAALALEGVKPTIVTAGRYKAEFTELMPLSEEAHARLQQLVDDSNKTFRADIAKGRGTTVKTVGDTYGQGRMFTAREALDAGMIDRIETFEQAFTRLAKGGGKTSKPGRRAQEDLAALEPTGTVPAHIQAVIDTAATFGNAGGTFDVTFTNDEPADPVASEKPDAGSDEREVLELSLALDEQTIQPRSHSK